MSEREVETKSSVVYVWIQATTHGDQKVSNYSVCVVFYFIPVVMNQLHFVSRAAITRKTRVIDVVYNASNNELVRTKTLVKNAIVVVDATPLRQWYEAHYALPLARKKGAKLVCFDHLSFCHLATVGHKYVTRIAILEFYILTILMLM